MADNIVGGIRKVSFDKATNTLTVSIQLGTPRKSSTGKKMLLATDRISAVDGDGNVIGGQVNIWK